MTCADARDLFSARTDDALTAGERAALDTHLGTCAECAREWRRFAATVGLLHAVEPARAPAGFVDRVLAARPRPWYRRLARGLFVPWPVKLPLEAAAVVMIAGLAVLVFERSPDLQQAARAPDTAVSARAPEAPAPAAPAPVRPEDKLALGGTRPEPQGADTVAKSGAPPPAVSDTRKDDRARAAAPAETSAGGYAPRAAAPPAGNVLGQAREKEEPARAKEEQAPGRARQGLRDAQQPAPEGVVPAAPAPSGAAESGPRMARKEARAVASDVEARLATSDRAAAERDVRALVARLGGVVTAPDAETLQVVVPRAAWDELARELGRLGTLRVERRPVEMPSAVRVTLRLE
jgi:hypothetical protein